ncbi:MAG: S-adenosylmethionine:tRNA ribosyltransferase-isomerase, partial [Acidobacteriota bacterium]|nr:S-adenosylmethionine:tRNA ribosyltransferase-isomerase [Acidobacteriota bacterium]
MRADRFDYDLPRERIAEEAAPRGESRLMVVGEGVEHTEVSALPTLLRSGDLVVVNNTRVLPARLYSTRAATGGRVEILLVEKVGERTWKALLKPARRLRKGERLMLEPGLEGSLAEDPVDGRATLDLTRPAEEFLSRLGHVPLPPYIHRADNTHDRERYQTVYASELGAIAAPTAGLHFGDEDLEALRAAGVEIVEITLHVGIGTFR